MNRATLFRFGRAQPECLSKHLFCLLVLALIPRHHRQIVHAHPSGWILFTQYRLAQPKYFSKYLFRLLIFALIPQQCRQVVHARWYGWTLFTQHHLAGLSAC